MALFDMLMAAAGRPNPQTQLAAYLNQAPGQVGSNTPGPVPGAPGPQGSPSGGGAPNPAQGAPQAAGGPPQGQGGTPPATMPNGQQAPNAFQSPSDLGSLYLQLAQRQQASNQFNTGLGLLAASAYPGRRPDIIMNAMRDMNQQNDPAETFGNLVKLQMFGQQQQRYADLVNNSDAYAKSFGVDPTMFKATITAAGPQGAGDVLGKIAEAQMGITGSQTDKEYRQAVRNYQTANPGQPLPPELQTEAGFVQKQGAAVTMADAKAKDLAADQANFAPAKDAYDREIADVNWLIAPEQRAAMNENIGLEGKFRPYSTLSDAGQAWFNKYKQVMASQYSSGVQDFKGAGRITQRELEQDLPSQSTMSNLNQSENAFTTGATQYLKRLQTNRAQLFGKAGQLNSPDLSDEDYGKVNEIYKPGEGNAPAGSLYVAGQTPRRAPQANVASPNAQPVSSPASAPSAPSGQKLSDADLATAKANMAKYGRDYVIKYLQGKGYDTSGL